MLYQYFQKLYKNNFRLENKDNEWIVIDTIEYEDKKLTDEEYAELFNNRKFDEVMKQGV